MEDRVIGINLLFERLEKLGPVFCALFATVALAFMFYMVFVDWKAKREAELLEKIDDLEAQVARKEKEIEKLMMHQCSMAYEMNSVEAEKNKANARAKNSDKRADRMAVLAEEYRRKSESVA